MHLPRQEKTKIILKDGITYVHIILSEKKCSIQNFSLNTALYSIIIVFNFDSSYFAFYKKERQSWDNNINEIK